MTNWPLLFREICEAYHCLPDALENLTYDQLYILAARKGDLSRGIAITSLSVDELRAIGKVPIIKPGQPTSLVQRIRAQKAAASHDEKLSKRERRRRHGEEIKAARARGEKI